MTLDGTLPGPGGGPAGPGTGTPDMASSPTRKRAAANALQQHIEPDTRKAGDHADPETGKAVQAFDAKDGHGWLTSGALKKANKAWETQVKGLLSRLGADRTALRSTNLLFSGTDLGVDGDIRRPSAIDRL